MDYIVEFAVRAAPRRELFMVVLWVLLDGHQVPEPCVRWAYSEIFARVTAAAASAEAVGVASTGLLASGARRAFRDLANGDEYDRPTDPGHHARNVNEIAALALIAEETLTDDQALELYGAAAHLPAIKTTGLDTKIDDLTSDDFADVLADMSVQRLQEIAATAPAIAFHAGARRARALAELTGSNISGYPDESTAVQPVVAIAQMKYQYESNMGGPRISHERLYELLSRGEINPDELTIYP